MIRREESESMWLIHQAAHAYVAGQIAEHWVGNGTLRLEPREELVLAAYAHDTGWAEAERCPALNRYGQPATFTEMELEEHLAIWQRSIDCVFAQNRYAALLVSLHCTALYEQRLRYVDDPPAQKTRIREFVGERHRWEDSLIAALETHPRYGLAVQPDHLALNRRLLQVWDYLSLLVCMGPVFEQTLEDVPVGEHERAILVVANGPRDCANRIRRSAAVIDARQRAKGRSSRSMPFGTSWRTSYRPIMFEFAPLTGGNGSGAQDVR